jgi:hypothetical protein
VNLNIGWTELHSALKTLGEGWEEVKAHWNDPVQQSFEGSFWTPLEAQARSALRGIERLMPVFVQLQRECGLPDSRSS